jgi:protoporphyrin/coproporphyrin ferrochelatase
MKYHGQADFRHGQTPLAAVVLVNLGTPQAPTATAVRRYLAEFLADPRVIELPRLLWRLILHGVILRIRPARSARAYQKVWTERGSPLLFHSRDLAEGVQRQLREKGHEAVEVLLAMRYGAPALSAVLDQLSQRNLRRLLVVPLYPQYSGTTTGSVFDVVARQLQRWRWVPELHFVSDYYGEPGYAGLLADRVRASWQSNGRGQHLLFSFHGIPERYLRAGDPYYCQCLATARATAEQLQLDAGSWSVSFQSRVGRERWLHPYTDQELVRLARTGVTSIDVICPAFAVDCLETIEEISIGERERFLAAGGERFHYIPALNAEPDHIGFLAELVRKQTAHWPEWMPADPLSAIALQQSAERHAAARPAFDQDAKS